MKTLNELTIIAITALLIFGGSARVFAQEADIKPEIFDQIEMLSPEGGKVREIEVRVHFKKDALEIESVSDRRILKRLNYADIRNAEYSYTKNPRWKTALGLGATAVIFPPILLIAIPLGFTKHRRHWLTVGTAGDYAVLKLGKSRRKIFMPSFEAHTGVRITALGDDK